jgi:homoserine kinase
MYPTEYLLARMVMEDRIREANRQRLAREFARREQPSTAPTAVPKARRRSRLWSLVHVRQAHSG